VAAPFFVPFAEEDPCAPIQPLSKLLLMMKYLKRIATQSFSRVRGSVDTTNMANGMVIIECRSRLILAK